MELELGHFTTVNDLQEQRELFRDSFPETRGTSVGSDEHYNWKFKQFPSDPPSFEFIIRESVSKKILGYYAALPFRYRVGGDIYRCGMVCDVMTHSSARGKGLFTRMGEYATNELERLGLDFVTGYPIRPEVLPGHLKVGWHVAEKLPVYVKVLKIDSLLKDSPLRLFTPILNCLCKLQAWLFRSRRNLKVGEYVKIEPASEFLINSSESYQCFFESWGRENPVHLIKDKSFLSWRLNAPGAKYHIISIRYESEIRALAIVRSADLKGIPSVAILDIMILSDHFDLTEVILRQIEIFTQEQSRDLVALMVGSKSASRYKLLQNGFIRTLSVFKLILKPLSSRAKDGLCEKKDLFNVMWIDSDDL